MLEVVFQDSQLQREYLLRCVLEYLSQFVDFHPLDIPYFVMLRDGFSLFHLAQEDKPYSWEPTLELLVAAEWDKGEAIVIFGRIGLGADIGIHIPPDLVVDQ